MVPLMNAGPLVIIGERRVYERRACERRACERRTDDRRQHIQNNAWTMIITAVGSNKRQAERRMGEQRQQDERRVNRYAPHAP